jgi:hypothetical protein
MRGCGGINSFNMKFVEPKNKNYCATVVALRDKSPLENCDNVVATHLFGLQAIVGKDVTEGDLGIVFPAETQLSEEFCRMNNLFRHNEQNDDKTKKGYLEDNRRVKAMKFRGHASNCLFLPLSSLEYLGLKPSDFKVGDEFDAVGDREICKKYVIREPGVFRGNHQAQPKRFNRVDTKFIPEHFDTENYFRNAYLVDPETEIIVTQKLHGTSVRIANTIVQRQLTLRDRIAKWFGIAVQDSEYDYVFGSRKVIKDINSPYNNNFYAEDIWTLEGRKFQGLLPEGFIVYAEIVGYLPSGGIIQADYDYGYMAGSCGLYIYRVAFVNPSGLVTDLSWNHVKEFCVSRGLKHVPELWRGKHKDFAVSEWMNLRYTDMFPLKKDVLPVAEGLVDEGVCIRTENNIIPYILKAKSPEFLEHETKMLDKNAADVESSEAVTEEV